jgi:hypothetical protein
MPITARQRRALPRGQYVYGPRSPVGGRGRKAYPISTKKQARAALSYAGQSRTGGTYRTVEKAVNRRFPSIQTKHHKPRR